MLKFVKQMRFILGRRTEEIDLNREAALAATDYARKMGAGVDLATKQQCHNWVAHGFYIGYRECEKRSGK